MDIAGPPKPSSSPDSQSRHNMPDRDHADKTGSKPGIGSDGVHAPISSHSSSTPPSSSPSSSSPPPPPPSIPKPPKPPAPPAPSSPSSPPPSNRPPVDSSRSSAKPLIIGIVIAILVLVLAVGVAIWFAMQIADEDVLEDPAEEAVADLPEADPDSEAVAEPETPTFTLTPPARWAEQPGLIPEAEVVYAAPDSQQTEDGVLFTPNINVVTEDLPPETSLDQFVEASKAALMQLDYESIDDARVQTVQGIPAHILGGTFGQDGTDLRNKQLLAVSPDGTIGYVVTGTALAEGWDAGEFDRIFDEALTSLVLVE